jgi:hypothetical protein
LIEQRPQPGRFWIWKHPINGKFPIFKTPPGQFETPSILPYHENTQQKVAIVTQLRPGPMVQPVL